MVLGSARVLLGSVQSLLKGLGAWVAEEDRGLERGTGWLFARLEVTQCPVPRGGLEVSQACTNRSSQ